MTTTHADRVVADLVAQYRARLPRSQEHHARASASLPGGVTSNLRAWEPFPVYFERGEGARLWDIDGNKYIDCASAQGVLAVGHRHPAVIAAVSRALSHQTVNGASHQAESILAELLLARYPFHQRVRLTNTGSEAVAHGIRLARAATGRATVLKAEGTYHGNYDATMVSFTPRLDEAGPAARPNTVPITAGLTDGAIGDTRVFPYNDIEALRTLFDELAGTVAAVIIEPVILNMGCTPADPDFLRELRQLCNRDGTMLIFDEAKTGCKIAWGGGPEVYHVQPDITLLAKAIGGGFPIGAILASDQVLAQLVSHKVWQTGSFAGNPVSVAAAIATLQVLTPHEHDRVASLNQRLKEGLEAVIDKHDLDAHVRTAGVTGSVFFRREQVRNYRDAHAADETGYWTYWYGMVNAGVIPQAYGRDDAWTLTIAHTEADIDGVIAAFAGVGTLLRRRTSSSAKQVVARRASNKPHPPSV